MAFNTIHPNRFGNGGFVRASRYLAVALLAALIGGTTGCLAQCKQAYSWVMWTKFQGNTATGTLLADGQSISVDVQANYPIRSAVSLFQIDRFSGFSDYTSLPGSVVPRVDWSVGQDGETTICFSKPVSNPVLVLSTLGNDNQTIKLTFSRPYVALFSDAGIDVIDEQTTRGTEGNAVLLFPGTFTCLTVKTDDFESFTDFTWGVRPSAFPLAIGPPRGCELVSLTATGGVSHEWNGGQTPSQATNVFDQSGTYIVKATNAQGCTAYASTSVTVSANCTPSLLVPTAFSPNGDGINDVFAPAIINGDIAGLTVYNRWGIVVYSEIGSNPTWLGTQDAGVYSYELTYRTPHTSIPQQHRGTVWVLR